MSADERKLLNDYQLLTAKPLLVVLNMGEEALPQAAAQEEALEADFGRSQVRYIAMGGKLEMELAQLSPEEKEEFRRSLGAGDSGRERVLQASYALLDLVSFFTTVSREVKAWSLRRDTPAVEAAGRIHSDMERGFIRAEVVTYDDLTHCRTLAQARSRGLLRQEGKNYPVKDGDVITFLFNV